MRRLYQAATLACALAALSCDTGTGVDTAGMSRVNVFLADGPGAVEAVWLQFDQIYLISIPGAEGGRLVELLDEPTGLIEVTSLVDSVEALALSVPVEPGSYNELRLILGSAVLETEEGRVFTFGDPDLPDSVDVDGQLHCPSCSSSGLKVVFDVEMEEGTGDIVVDFDVGQSFGHEAGKSGRWIMRPIIRALHDKHDDDEEDDDDDDGDDDDDDGDDDDDEDDDRPGNGKGRGRGRGQGGDQDRFASISGDITLGTGVTIPACPAGTSRSIEDFMPTATADSLDNADGADVVATGHVDEDDDEAEFKIWRLKADTWTLGHKAETVLTEAGHKLVWAATVSPTTVELSAGERAEDVEYTITSVTCQGPTP
jgi:hypothetical protein